MWVVSARAALLAGLASAGALGVATLGCERRREPPTACAAAESPAAPPGFLKGQLHAHTGNSDDSDTEPAVAAAWYASRGYDFVVFTDHNVVTDIPSPPGMLLLRGVELTQNYETCAPAPEPGEACLLHVSGLFVAPHAGFITFGPRGGLTRLDLYARAVERGAALGGLTQLDHPNFHHGADAGLLVALARRGLALVEIENAAIDSGNEGDAAHPSTEALWDAALARGARVFGTATDDAHHYHDADAVRARGRLAYTGDRGFVMVRAEKRPEAIRAAVAAGDFYGSTGLVFERLEIGREAIAVDAPEEVSFEVVGDGRVVHAARARALRYDPRAAGARIVRVRAVDAGGRRAFTQPVWM